MNSDHEKKDPINQKVHHVLSQTFAASGLCVNVFVTYFQYL